MITTINEFKKVKVSKFNINENIQVIARNRDHLKMLINLNIQKFGTNCNLNYIDVSNVTDMSELFKNTKFNGKIDKWNVSNVTIMEEMFEGSNFNGDISNWDVNKVTDMSYMFHNSNFNQDINNWNVDIKKCVTTFMFEGSSLETFDNLPQWYLDKFKK